MFSQLKFVAVSLAVFGGGCAFNPVQRVQNSPMETDPPTMVAGDPAMQLRRWERSTAEYGNGNVIAGPTGFWYQARWDQPEWTYVPLEVPLFLVQTIALPVTLTMTPPWTPVMYSGVSVPPTYTALPPIPGRGSMANDMSASPAPAAQP
jgi:hypothetical protein